MRTNDAWPLEEADADGLADGLVARLDAVLEGQGSLGRRGARQTPRIQRIKALRLRFPEIERLVPDLLHWKMHS